MAFLKGSSTTKSAAAPPPPTEGIAKCQLPICQFVLEFCVIRIGNWQSAIGNLEKLLLQMPYRHAL